MVLHVPGDESAGVGAVEATGRTNLPQPSGLGATGCLQPRNSATRTNRAHLGKARIKARLIADLDPDQWDLPPKPKWMRWSTYNRYVERYDNYEAILDYGCACASRRSSEKISFEINGRIQVSQEISIQIKVGGLRPDPCRRSARLDTDERQQRHGRPAQSLDVGINRKSLEEMTDAELLAVAAGADDDAPHKTRQH